MPVQITLHINGDPAGQPTESATMSVGTTTVPNTKTIEADMVDELGVTTNSAPVVISNNNTVVATVSGTTLTATSPGGATLVASCIPPTCGVGINTPVYSNPFQVTVVGSSPQTFVYATTSFAPPTGSPSLIPIDTSKTPIVAGTAITLPGTPNSMMFAPNGSRAFLGTSAGIASFSPGTSTVTLLDPFIGKVLAVSPDGNTAIFSNAANDPGTGSPIEPHGPAQRLVILNGANNTVQRFVLPGAVSASFTSDGFKAFIAADCSHNLQPGPCPPGLDPTTPGNVMVFSPFLTLQVLNIGASSNNSSVVTLPSASYAYFANSAGLQAMATCNDVPASANNPPTNPPTQTTAIQLLGATSNANFIVAVDSPGVDIVTATPAPLAITPPLSAANCGPAVNYIPGFVDFGQGPFTAHQLLVPSNGTGGNNGSHVVVLPAGTPNLFVAVPGVGPEVIPLTGAGATEALSGGMTLDGNTAWVGVAGSNTVDQILLTNSPSTADALHITTSFTKGDGTPAPPNIVVVQPK
jgi:hypothetical protein